jgi:aminoglycoside 6-adenylyltransferase
MMVDMDYSSALQAVVAWATADPNVRSVVLTGSAAAGTHHPLSDRDLELHVLDARPLEADDRWWDSLGEVLAVERLENGDDQPTRLVYYVGGKLDFTLVQVGEKRGRYDRPFRVLLDKDGDSESFLRRVPQLGVCRRLDDRESRRPRRTVGGQGPGR